MSKVLEWLSNRPGYLLGGAAVVYLLLGWGQDGINLDSATYATIARNMADFGGWFTPHYTAFYYPAFAEHPPLVMWLQGLVFLAFGSSDSTARIIGALCTLGSILVVYRIGRHILGRHYGFLAGLTLLLTYNFIQIGNSTLLDVPMTFFVLVAMLGIIKMQKFGVTASNALLTGAALGLAWLAKGVVSGPAWAALVLTCLLFNRRWLRKKEFWLAPAAAIAIMGIHLLLDQAFAGGHFTQHYFLKQVFKRFLGGGPHSDSRWWEFSYRFAKLYLPFIILFPFGIYFAIKKRVNALYPIMITVVFFAIFLSVAAKLYYHYFCPVYALAAPISALPVALLLTEKQVKKLAFGFFILWILAAIGVKVADVRVHELRTAEIYSLNEPMAKLLDTLPSRNGLSPGTPPPTWDQIAKAAWYWRSDLRQIGNIDEAVKLLKTATYGYLLVERSEKQAESEIENRFSDVFEKRLGNDRISIYILKTNRPAGNE
ncbi:MAG: glycosyltransferase family 39 protein [Candidatus Zixiibacteriota bacterium]|nr:MAG: glycosyltransferase family 39 protein [candidate division Zixibacteria bacterium]